MPGDWSAEGGGGVSDEPTDHQLILKAQAGEEEALEDAVPSLMEIDLQIHGSTMQQCRRGRGSDPVGLSPCPFVATPHFRIEVSPLRRTCSAPPATCWLINGGLPPAARSRSRRSQRMAVATCRNL